MEQKSLYDQLRDNQDMKEAEFAEYRKLTQTRKRVDEEEAEFYNDILESERKREAEVKAKEEAALNKFKSAISESSKTPGTSGSLIRKVVTVNKKAKTAVVNKKTLIVKKDDTKKKKSLVDY